VIVSDPTFGGTGCPGNGATNSHVVAEYIFQEGGSTTTINSGTDIEAGDATLVNGAAFSTDVPHANNNCGWSVNLPSQGSGATTPAVETDANYNPLAGATNFTIMAWVKRESASSNNNTSARIVSDISSTSLTSTTAGVEFRFSGSSGTLALRVNGNELSTTVGGIAPNEANWHHVAVVYDGKRPATNALTRHVHFYVDGVQRGLGVSNATLNVTVSANSNPLTIGNSAVSRSVGNAFVGKMDDVRILHGFGPDAVGDGKTNDIIRCYMNRADDFEPPMISCPSDVIVTNDFCQPYASNVALGEPIVSDNCGIANVANNAPAQIPVGTSLVVWTVTDIAGNSSVCTQQVTVIDTRDLDSDGDGMPDCWELEHGLNPNDPSDANQPSTHSWAHGLTNLQVYQNPSVLLADNYSTLGDGIPDWWKIMRNFDLRDASVAKSDADGDGFSNFEEWWMETNPNNPAEPFTIHVYAEYAGDTELGGYEQPFKQIQSAIDAAPSDQSTAIRVRPGIYRERPYINGKAHIHIFSDAGPVDTIIDGENVDGSVVRIYNFARATFSGFTVRGALTDWMGAGLRIDSTNGVILVADNVITSNVTTNKNSSGGGGGMSLKAGDGSLILNNLITKNSARRGGGVLFARGNVRFWNNTVLENVATAGLGDGLSAIQGVQPDVQFNVIWGNIGSNDTAQIHQLVINNNIVQRGASGVGNQTEWELQLHRFRADSYVRSASYRSAPSAFGSGAICRTVPNDRKVWPE
jgi:hypothetical protein